MSFTRCSQSSMMSQSTRISVLSARWLLLLSLRRWVFRHRRYRSRWSAWLVSSVQQACRSRSSICWLSPSGYVLRRHGCSNLELSSRQGSGRRSDFPAYIKDPAHYQDVYGNQTESLQNKELPSSFYRAMYIFFLGIIIIAVLGNFPQILPSFPDAKGTMKAISMTTVIQMIMLVIAAAILIFCKVNAKDVARARSSTLASVQSSASMVLLGWQIPASPTTWQTQGNHRRSRSGISLDVCTGYVPHIETR